MKRVTMSLYKNQLRGRDQSAASDKISVPKSPLKRPEPDRKWKRQTRGIGTLCCGTVFLSGVCPCPAAADDCEEAGHETNSTYRAESRRRRKTIRILSRRLEPLDSQPCDEIACEPKATTLFSSLVFFFDLLILSTD